MLHISAIFLSALSLILIAGCTEQLDKTESLPSTDISTTAFIADGFLPEAFGRVSKSREPKVLNQKEALTSLGQSAELYELYGLIGIVAETYTYTDIDIFVEIAQYENSLSAYGLYSFFRPDSIEAGGLGSEGYFLGNSMYFSQHQFVITISSMDTTLNTLDGMAMLALMISANIGDTGSVPAMYNSFPDTNRIVPSNKFHPERFMGIANLSDVFSAKYMFGSDSLRLFMSVDSVGTKMVAMIENANLIGVERIPVPSLPFDDGFGMTYTHKDYGTVLVGLKNLKLIGAVGYNPTLHEQFILDWLNTL